MPLKFPLDANQPQACFFKMRLVKDGAFVAGRIWYGPPADPVTGETLDRSWRWQAEFNGVIGDPIALHVWPHCANHELTEDDYRYLCDKAGHAKENLPDSPEANPRRAINWNKVDIPL
jgi:hypothetical protein